MGSGASTAQGNGAKRILAVFICHSSQETELRKRISSTSSPFAGLTLPEDASVLIVTESFPKDQQTRAEMLAQTQVAVLAVDANFQQSPELIATVSFLKDSRSKVVAGPLTFHSRPSGALGAICFAFGVWEPGLFDTFDTLVSKSSASAPAPSASLEKALSEWGIAAGELALLSKAEAQSLLASRATAEREMDEVIAEDRAIYESSQPPSAGDTKGEENEEGHRQLLLLYVFTGDDGERVAATFAALPASDNGGQAHRIQLCGSQDLHGDLAALAQAHVASFVISDASLASPTYRRLFEAAVRWGKSILPINASKSRMSGWLAMAMAGKLWYQVDLDSGLEQIHTKYSEIPNCACKVDDSCLATDYLQCLSGLMDSPSSPMSSDSSYWHDRGAAIIQGCGEKAQVIGGLSADSVQQLCTRVQTLVAAFEGAHGSDPEAQWGLEALGVAMSLPTLEQQRLKTVEVEEKRSCSVAPQDLLPKFQANPELKLANIHYQVTRMGFHKIPSVLDARGVPLPNLQLDAMFSYQWGVQKTVLDVHQQGQVHNLRAWFDVFGHMQGNVNAAMATAVENVACVVVFLTRAYIASINCRLEFQYAANCSKPMVLVFLEDPRELTKELPDWITDVAGTTELNVYPSLLRENSDGQNTSSSVLALDFTCSEIHNVSTTTALFGAIRQLAAARHRGKPRIAYDGSLLLYATTSALRHDAASVSGPPRGAGEPSMERACSRCGVAFLHEIASSLDGCRKHSAYYMGGNILAGRWVCCQEQQKDGPGCQPAQHVAEPRAWTQDPSYGTFSWKPE